MLELGPVCCPPKDCDTAGLEDQAARAGRSDPDCVDDTDVCRDTGMLGNAPARPGISPEKGSGVLTSPEQLCLQLSKEHH